MTDNLLPAGTYKAVAMPVEVDGTISYVQFGTSSGEKKTKQVLVQFEILEGPYAGRKVPWWGYFTQKTYTRTVESLRLCGFKGDDLMDLLTQELGNEVSIVTEVSEWNGKTNARVSWINSAGSGIKMANPMATNDLRAFAAQLKAKVGAIKEVPGKKAERGTAPAPEAAEPSPPPSDDDCPF